MSGYVVFQKRRSNWSNNVAITKSIGLRYINNYSATLSILNQLTELPYIYSLYKKKRIWIQSYPYCSPSKLSLSSPLSNNNNNNIMKKEPTNKSIEIGKKYIYIPFRLWVKRKQRIIRILYNLELLADWRFQIKTKGN